MTHPPAGPTTPPPPSGPKLTHPTPDPLPPPPKPAEMTWRQREEWFARWNAAEEEQRATDSMREHSRYGRETDADRRRLHAAEQAWDYVRGAS